MAIVTIETVTLTCSEPFPVTNISGAQWLGLTLFPFGLIAGFVVGWWKEGLGGAITIGSLLAFYLVFVFLLNGNLIRGAGFLVFAFPGFLFLLSWFMSHVPPTLQKSMP